MLGTTQYDTHFNPHLPKKFRNLFHSQPGTQVSPSFSGKVIILDEAPVWTETNSLFHGFGLIPRLGKGILYMVFQDVTNSLFTGSLYALNPKPGLHKAAYIDLIMTGFTLQPCPADVNALH